MIADDISDTDIVFECPACNKSMAIDRRGAGRIINCSGCGKRLTVPQPTPEAATAPAAAPAPAAPVPEAAVVEPAGLKSTKEQLTDANAQLLAMGERLREVTARRKYLEHVRVKNLDRFEKVRQEFSVIQGSLDRLYLMMQELDADRENS